MSSIMALLLPVLMFSTPLAVAEQAQSDTDMRRDFLQAEQYINQNREAEFNKTANTLKNYALYPYLQYQWLKKHLDNTQAVQAFLQDYPGSRYNNLLRQKWLQQLGKNRQWDMYLQNYHAYNDNELQCYRALAQFYSNQQTPALQSARQFWLSGKPLPDNCNELLQVFVNSSEFTAELWWRRFHSALQQNNTQLAEQLKPQLPPPLQTDAELWLKIHRQPETVAQAQAWKQQYPLAPQLFAHALKRWADRDIVAAIPVWDNEKQNFALSATEQAEVEKQLALALAFKHDNRAYQRLSQLSNKDDASNEWRVRAALLQQNWQQAADALADLSPEQQQQEKWRYWQAKTVRQLKGADAAAPLYQDLAQNRSFYGLLAAAQLQQPLMLNDHPITVAAAELQYLATMPEFKVMSELLALNRITEAKLQWWFALNSLKPQELVIAAKLAEQWHCPGLAILTLAKANQWDDVNLRFPLLHSELVKQNAQTLNLDPALVYGIIRQESAFDEYAESPAGALGLMQIMPGTAKQIAGELPENWRDNDSLFNPALNIRYGAYYFQKLLKQFDNHVVLAAAAYNAGANRVKRWRGEIGSVPVDVWLENIPYKETRSYAASVLFYSVIYQQRLQRDSLKLPELLKDVN